MNDQHPHAGYVGYDSHSTGSFDTDPLFGSLPGSYDGTYDTTGYNGYDGGYDDRTRPDTAASTTQRQWDAGAHQTADVRPPTPRTRHPAATQQYATTATWMPACRRHSRTGAAPRTLRASGTPTAGYQDRPVARQPGRAAYDTGAYDATAWNTGATPEHDQQTAQTAHTAQESYETRTDCATAPRSPYEAHEAYESYADHGLRTIRTSPTAPPSSACPKTDLTGDADTDRPTATAATTTSDDLDTDRAAGRTRRRRPPPREPPQHPWRQPQSGVAPPRSVPRCSPSPFPPPA